MILRMTLVLTFFLGCHNVAGPGDASDLVVDNSSLVTSHTTTAVKVAGFLRNNSGKEMRGVRVALQVYDASDRLLGIGQFDPGFGSKSWIQPQALGPFEVGTSLDGKSYLEVTRYTLEVSSDAGLGGTFSGRFDWQ